MKTIVCVKQVGMLSDEVELTDDGRAVDPDYLDFALNEWDACAVEQALQLREAVGGEVLAVTVGDEEAEAALHRALAMGADRALRVWTDALPSAPDPIAIARALAAAIRAEAADLVLCGVQSADLAHGATGAALAGVLELPCVAVCVGVEPHSGRLGIRRELEGGLVEQLEVTLPALITIQTGINVPRYVTFRAIKQAEATAIGVVDPGDLGPAGHVLRSLAAPQKGDGPELIRGNPAAIAGRIATIVAERRG